jgi:hypothetical protein
MKYENLWPTIIGSGKFKIPGLVEHIFANYDLQSPPTNMSSTNYNIFNDQSTTMKQFYNLVYDKFDEYLKNTIDKKISDWKSYELKAWITGYVSNYSMPIHNHSGAHLSGVFYVLAEDQNSGGDIMFSDPRTNANRGYDQYFNTMFAGKSHRPKTGDYMIFPSFTYHHVNPYYSILRICIPVDLYLNI